MKLEAESENWHPAVCRSPVLHSLVSSDLWLWEGDETQNSQLLISAEVIRRGGGGEAELIF